MSAIHTPDAPQPIGPYSQARVAGDLLFISGQIAIDPASGRYDPADAAAETRQVMQNLQAILACAGAGFDQVVKTSIFLKEMADFDAVNQEYSRWFDSLFPARETVEVSQLPKNARVEISMVVCLQR